MVFAGSRVRLYHACMGDAVAGETAEELIALAKARGFRVSKTQLARWHRAGLLPSPRQEGLGRGRGTQSVYAPGTGKQLVALLEIRADERRLVFVAWKLWWAGYDTPTKVVRALLSQVADRWERFLRTVVTKEGPSKRGLDFLERVETARLTDKTLRQWRRRVGKRRFSTFVLLMLQLVSATFKDWRDQDDPKIFSRGLGLPPADQLANELAWLLDAASQEKVSQLLRPGAFREALEKSSDEALIRERDQARLLLSSVSLVGLGLGVFSDLYSTDPWPQIAFLLVWLVLRPRLFEEKKARAGA